jgi:hypothetical protein
MCITRIAVSLCVALSIPGLAYAQASIAGVVRDTSGAVLPGVTVEAASPALIEKVRTVVTDGAGSFRIIQLRPGTYSVTFTLAGFSTVRREGIELQGDFVATVNADMRVGALEETITVSGEAPLVDTASTRSQKVLDRELIRDIPSARQYYSAAALIPGLSIPNTFDVGGSQQPAAPDFIIHGARAGDGRLTVDGISVGQRGGSGDTGSNRSMYILNVGSVQETTISTSGGLGEAESAGVAINMVPREGGNTHRGSVFWSQSNGALQGNNFTPELQAQGLRSPNELKNVWEFTPQEGGPIVRDRLWYFFSYRYQGSRNWIAGMYYNKNAGDITKWTYEPDLTRRALDDGTWKSGSLRLTYQATSKDKLAVFWDEQKRASAYLGGGSATTSPEAAGLTISNPSRAFSATWTRPHTSRVLFEAGFGGTMLQWGGKARQPLNPDLIRVTEQAGIIPGLTYRQQTWASNFLRPLQQRGSVSYVTGSHTAKFGYQHTSNYLHDTDRNPNPLAYRFNNGVPNQLTLSDPVSREAQVNNHSIYAQDSWKIGNLTAQGGIRYDTMKATFPEQSRGFTPYVPNGYLIPPFEGPRLHDITPRMAASYDLRGDGRTALKVTLGQYPTANEIGLLGERLNPTINIVNSVNRSWRDTDADFVPDCDLINPSANGECGQISNLNFGKPVLTQQTDPELLDGGWGLRQYNWEFSALVQRQLSSTIAVEVGYFRRWFGNQLVTDNLEVGPGDFDTFGISVPSDPRLPDGGGYTLTGLQNVRPDKFGRVNNFVTLAENFGGKTEYWQGVDISATGRGIPGLTFQGGTSMGKSYVDVCDLAAQLPEYFLSGAGNTPEFNVTFGSNAQTPLSQCKVSEDLQVQFKGLASYIVPKIDVLISGTIQSAPGRQLAANFNVPNAVVAASLGRNLSGGAANTTVNIVESGKQYGPRTNELDLRFAKILRVGSTRTNVAIDIFNALNGNVGTAFNQTYGPRYLTPTAIMPARFAKFSMQFDF